MTTRVEPLTSATAGPPSREKKFIIDAIADAMRSGLCRARRLGTSSAITRDTYVIATTTITNAIVSLYSASHDICRSLEESRSVSVRSPIAPVRIAIRVIPICTVARNRSGWFASSRAVCAPWLPSFANCCRRGLRDETTAISAITKMPLTMISRIIASIGTILSKIMPGTGDDYEFVNCGVLAGPRFLVESRRRQGLRRIDPRESHGESNPLLFDAQPAEKQR